MSVIVVSNRVARIKPDAPIAGGLAAALLPMVRDSGAIWVGSSGQPRDVTQTGDVTQTREFAKIESLGAGALATVDMPAKHYRGFYEGFANSALWPTLHSRPDLIHVTADDYTSYREVNAFMARALLRFNGPEAVFWIQDYHFLMLGEELRRLEVNRPLGFFLHTPWAARRTFAAVPHHAELAEAMLAYDLIGFQTVEDRRNFEDYLQAELGLNVVDGTVASEWGLTQLATFPIGIDVEDFSARAIKAVGRPEVVRLRESLQGAKLLLGVDRLHARTRTVIEAPNLAVAGGGAVARQHQGLPRAQGRTRRPGRRGQRPPRRSRLDADPLSEQGLFAAQARRLLPRGGRRSGHAAA